MIDSFHTYGILQLDSMKLNHFISHLDANRPLSNIHAIRFSFHEVIHANKIGLFKMISGNPYFVFNPVQL